MLLLNSKLLYYCRKLKSKIFLKNNDSYHLGATSKHFSFNCFNSYFPPFLWPLICSYWDWLTDKLVNKQNLVWFWSNQMFLRSGVLSKHLEEGHLPQMFKNPSPRQKLYLNQKNITDNKTSNNNLSFKFILKLYSGSFLCFTATWFFQLRGAWDAPRGDPPYTWKNIIGSKWFLGHEE